MCFSNNKIGSGLKSRDNVPLIKGIAGGLARDLAERGATAAEPNGAVGVEPDPETGNDVRGVKRRTAVTAAEVVAETGIVAVVEAGAGSVVGEREVVVVRGGREAAQR